MPQDSAFEINDDELMADGMGWRSYNIDSTEFVTHQYELEEEMSFVLGLVRRYYHKMRKLQQHDYARQTCYGHINFRTATSVD